MKLYDSIPENTIDWIKRQPVFFTASAPTHGRHVNCSPKGLATSHFAVLSPNQIAYVDRTGSGCETIAHAYENGRMTIMLMSFGTAPGIVRLFCHSRIIEWDSPDFPEWMTRVTGGDEWKRGYECTRAVIVGDVWQAQTSCGYGVPRVRREFYAAGEAAEDEDVEAARKNELSIFEDRPTLNTSCEKRENAGLTLKYLRDTNTDSLDGLPGLRAARRDAGEQLWIGDLRARLLRVLKERDGILFGILLSLIAFIVVRWAGL